MTDLDLQIRALAGPPSRLAPPAQGLALAMSEGSRRRRRARALQAAGAMVLLPAMVMGAIAVQAALEREPLSYASVPESLLRAEPLPTPGESVDSDRVAGINGGARVQDDEVPVVAVSEDGSAQLVRYQAGAEECVALLAPSATSGGCGQPQRQGLLLGVAGGPRGAGTQEAQPGWIYGSAPQEATTVLVDDEEGSVSAPVFVGEERTWFVVAHPRADAMLRIRAFDAEGREVAAASSGSSD